MRKFYFAMAALSCTMMMYAAGPVSIRNGVSDWKAISNAPIGRTVSLPKVKAAPALRSVDEPQTVFTATEASFYDFGDALENGTNAYYLFLSTAEMRQGNPTQTCQMARIFFLTEPTDGSSDPVLPIGTFPYAETAEAGTLVPEMTEILDVFPNPDDPSLGLVAYSFVPADGTLTIEKDDEGVYTISLQCEGVLLDQETGDEIMRQPCEVTYTGAVPYEDIYAYIPLEGDYELNIPNLSGRYSDGDYTLTFYSVALDEDGFIIGGGDLLNAEIFVDNVSPMNPDDLVGTYSPVDVFTEGPVPGKYMQGVWYDVFGGYYAAIGTSLTVYDENVEVTNVGLATEGSITVTKEGNEHKFVFDLVTPEGHKMTGSWQGVVADYVSDYTSGVETIGNDVVIAGGKGRVIAPAGAEVYTLSGVRTGSESLAAGCYIVRNNGTVKKVMVK